MTVTNHFANRVIERNIPEALIRQALTYQPKQLNTGVKQYKLDTNRTYNYRTLIVIAKDSNLITTYWQE